MVAKLLETMPDPTDGNGGRTLSRTASAARKLAAEIEIHAEKQEAEAEAVLAEERSAARLHDIASDRTWR